MLPSEQERPSEYGGAEPLYEVHRQRGSNQRLSRLRKIRDKILPQLQARLRHSLTYDFDQLFSSHLFEAVKFATYHIVATALWKPTQSIVAAK